LERAGTKSTDPLQVSVNDAKPVQVFHPMCNVHQLLKPFTSAFARDDMVTHKLRTVYFPVLPDELIDIAVIHPFRHHRKPLLCLHAKQR